MKKKYMSPKISSIDIKIDKWVLVGVSTVDGNLNGTVNKDNEDENPEDFEEGY